MGLKITNLNKDGDATKEYILLKATADVDISNYAIVDRTYNNEGKVSNVHKHFYRFPKNIVKKDEYVSLRTGKGKNELGKLNDGSTVHRFYWNSNASFWNDNEVEKAELLKVSTIESLTT